VKVKKRRRPKNQRELCKKQKRGKRNRLPPEGGEKGPGLRGFGKKETVLRRGPRKGKEEKGKSSPRKKRRVEKIKEGIQKGRKART